MGNAEGISHGQRLVAAGCRVCGMGYEMVGLRFAFQKKKCKTQLAFCTFRRIGLGFAKRKLRL